MVETARKCAALGAKNGLVPVLTKGFHPMSNNAYVPENGMRRHGGGLGRPSFFCVLKVPSEPSSSLKSSRYEIVWMLILRGQGGSESF